MINTFWFHRRKLPNEPTACSSILINISFYKFFDAFTHSFCMSSFLFICFYFPLKFAAPHCTEGLWFFSLPIDKEQPTSSNGLYLQKRAVCFLARKLYWRHGKVSVYGGRDGYRSFHLTAHCCMPYQHAFARMKHPKAFVASEVSLANIVFKTQASHPSGKWICKYPKLWLWQNRRRGCLHCCIFTSCWNNQITVWVSLLFTVDIYGLVLRRRAIRTLTLDEYKFGFWQISWAPKSWVGFLLSAFWH